MSDRDCVTCAQPIGLGVPYYESRQRAREHSTCRTERETIARVVAWLRREAAKHNGPMPGVDPVGSVRVIADAIEEGAWREDGDG